MKIVLALLPNWKVLLTTLSEFFVLFGFCLFFYTGLDGVSELS